MFGKYIDKIKKSSFASKLLKNAAVSFVGEGGAAVVTFITTIILIRLIGNTAYGIMSVAYSFILMIDNLVNFQAWHAMVTFGSKAIENKNFSYLESLIKVGSIIDFSTAICGMIISTLFASLVSHLMSWNAETTKCIYILAFMILFNFTGTSVGIIRLLDKFKYYSIFRIITECLRFFFVIVFCGIMKMGLYGATWAYALGYIIGYIILFGMFIYTIRITPFLSIKRIMKSDIKGTWKEIFKFTFWTSLSSSADIPVQQMDVIFLSLISYDIVAVFKVYKQICQVLNKLATPLKQSVMPLFSELIAQDKTKECYKYLLKMRKKSQHILIPIVFIMTAGSIAFMYLFLDFSYVKYWYILLIYLLLRAFSLSYTAIHPLFVAMGEVKKNFWYTLLANGIYIALVGLTVKTIGIWSILLGLLFEYFIIIYLKKRAIQIKVCENTMS